MQSYLFSTTAGRTPPNQPFATPTDLWTKRYREQTNSLALSVSFLVPFLNDFNAKLEHHIKTGNDPDNSVLLKDALQSLKTAAINFTDLTSRVVVSSGIATYLIKKNTPVTNSIVYQADMYPRLHQNYIGNLLAALHLPRWLAAALGPATQNEDLEFFQSPIGPGAAFQDSVYRHCLTTAADVVVGSARVIIVNATTPPEVLKKANATSTGRQVAAVIVNSSSQLVGKASGAAIGSQVSRGKGEYWGEVLGGLAATAVAARLLVALKLSKRPESTPAATTESS